MEKVCKVMGNTATSKSERGKVDRLVSMGFDREFCVYALQECNYDSDRAIEFLINNSQGGDSSHSRSRGKDQAATLRRDRAVAAAEARQRNQFGNVSTKLGGKREAKKSEKNYESELDRLCTEMGEFPAAVDMIVYMLGTILSNPSETKYRQVKRTNQRFKDTIGVSGATGIRLLSLMGFRQAGDWYVLRENTFDSARLWLAKSVLEKVQSLPRYVMAKERQLFNQAMKESLSSANAEEVTRRKEYVPKVPVEPDEGIAGTTRITVFCGDKVLQRRFASDDVLRDIIMWLGATHSSLIPEKLMIEAEWELMDRTLYPRRIIDISKNIDKTLQAGGLWPSAELQIQPSGTLDHEMNVQ